MASNVTAYIDVREKLARLGCRNPTGFAILPINFESAESIKDFRQASEAATVKTLLRSENLPHDDIVGRQDRPPYIQNNAFEWIAPTLFVSATLVSQNPVAISVALNVLGNYATDFFRGLSGKKTVKIEIVVEQAKAKSCKKISYEGPSDGLKDLADIIRSTKDD